MINCFKIFLLPIFLSQILFAQNGNNQIYKADNGKNYNYLVKNITIAEGLQSNNIYDILQDNLGFLWLASGNGLQKYDGYTITLYTPDSSDVLSQKALRLYEDMNSNLWIQMESGLIRYNRELDNFVKYIFVNGENDTIPYQVTSMAESVDSTLWVWIQDQGLYKVNFENKTFTSNNKVNRTINRTFVFKPGKQKGIYETQVRFPAGYYGLDLYYKFAIKRKDGTLEFESNPNPDDPSGYGNRILTLRGDTLILPVTSFNSNIKNYQGTKPSLQTLDARPTFVKIKFNVNKLENPLLKGDEIHIKGDKLPLIWGDNPIVNSMVFDIENNLWISLDSQGLFQFNLETGDFKNFVADSGISGSISSNTVNTAICDPDGNLWFGNSRGLSRYNPDKESFENFFIDSTNNRKVLNHIFRMTDDGQGNIWTISQEVKGLGCFNKLKKEFLHYSKGLDAWISSVTTDRSGIIWLGNWYQGIYKFNPKVKKFSAFSIKKNKNDLLDKKRILAVYKDKAGEIWIGGELGGLYRYNRETGKTSFYKIKDGNFENWIENYIWDIFQDSKGNFWIATQGGLCSFNPQSGNFKHIQQPHNINLGLGTTAKILEDKSGNLWLVTRNGLLIQVKLNTYETEIYPLDYPFNYPQESPNRSYPDIIKDPRGYLWIGWSFDQGRGGIIKFDLKKKKLLFIKHLKNFNITSLCLDNEILWCGTNESGLIRYNTKINTKTLINTNNGLLSNSIMGLEKDNSGNLWISSPRGLTKYNPQTAAFNHYFKEDGFITNNFTYSAHSKSENGELIFGSLHGVITFYPDSISNSEYLPPIVLTDFKIDNGSAGVGGYLTLKKNISVSDEIELTHNQNDIIITFASMDFNHPDRIKYSFYLENFEEDWRLPGLERNAYYTNLDPGEYIFKVKGSNSDGIWNEKPTSLKITILPPWWKTWWAYSFYVLLFISLIYSLRRYELNRIGLKNQVKMDETKLKEREQIDRMKSTFFTNISHEFRTPLTLILGPLSKLISSETDQLKKSSLNIMNRNAKRLLKLINQLLDFSKLESGKMNLQASKGDIVSFVKGLLMSFQTLAENKNINVQFTCESNNIEIYFDRQKVEKIIINLLSNAFKFTQEHGNIQVNILKQEKSVIIKIKDTGIGIAAEKMEYVFDRFYQADDSSTRKQEGTGIGLALTKELVELHKGKIEVSSHVNHGSEFTLSLPIGKAHLKEDQLVAHETVLSNDNTNLNEQEILIGKEESNKDINTYSEKIVLIVEDNADMRLYIREILYPAYKVVEACDGAEGVEIARKVNPVLIISDLMMPKLDGYQFCTKIKTDEHTSHIPVILLTAKASSEDKLQGLETGADDYLTKPFNTQELQIRVKNLIDQRKLLQEKFQHQLTVSPSEITVTSLDEQLLQRAIESVENTMNNPDLNTSMLAKEIGISRMLLHTKIKALTGQSTGEFIRILRLKRAAQLLQQGSGNVSQVAFEVGFQNLSYFAKTFRKQFGVSPSSFSTQHSI